MPPLKNPTKGPEIQTAVDELVRGWPAVTTGKMFGSHTYRANNVLFAMIGGKGLILTKLTTDQREVAAREHDAHAFVGRGKKVPAWIEFPLDDGTGILPIAPLVRGAYEKALGESTASKERRQR